MARTATVTVYNDPGTGDIIYTGTITFPEQIGYEHRIWNFIGGSFGIHTFRLPFEGEAYGIRTTSGVINGPTPVQGFRFNRIEIDFDTATPSLATDDVHTWHFVTGSTIVLGTAAGGIRHSHGPRNAFRIRTVLNATADTVFGNAAMKSKATYMGPGYEMLFPSSLIVPAGGATDSAMNYLQIETRHGLTFPLGYLDSGFGVGGGALINHLAGYEQNYRVARRRANGIMDRHGVDCIDYYTGDPAPASLVNHNPGPGLSSGYGRANGANGEGWKYWMQPSNFWAGAPDGAENVFPRWANGFAGTYETYQVVTSVQMGTHHLRNVTGQVEAMARVWGDPIAEFDLGVVAADVEYRIIRYMKTLELESWTNQGLGSTLLGARHYNWSADALGLSPIERHRKMADKLARMMLRQQMTNGALYRHGLDHGYNPDPWASGSTGGTLSDDMEVHQTMEMCIAAFVVARLGYPEMAVKWVEAMYVGGVGSGGASTDLPLYTIVGGGYRPKWVVPKARGQIEHRIRYYDGVGDYWVWVELGMGIMFSNYASQFFTASNTMASPYGVIGGNLAATLNQLKTEGSPKEQTAFFIAAAETYVP